MTIIVTLVLISTTAGIALLILSDRPSPKREHQWAERIRKTH